MLSWWLIFVIATILLLDVLLLIGMAIVVLFLIAYVAFNVLTGVAKLMINKAIHDFFDYLKKHAEQRSDGKQSGYGKKLVDIVQLVYRVAFWAYNIIQMGIDVAVVLATIALLVLGMVTFAFINIVLLWVIYTGFLS